MNLIVFFLQRGVNAFGVQRAGDWQKDGGEEAEEPGGQEEGAGREAGHGLWQQEVTLQHKHVIETHVYVFPVWMCVCSLSQCRVPLRDVRDAGDRAGNSCGSQVLHSVQTGPVWRAGLHLRTSKVSLAPPRLQSPLVYRPHSGFLFWEINIGIFWMFLGTRTTRSQWEMGSDPGGTPREGPPPSPPPGLWRRRNLKRRSPSPVFSPLGRGIYFDAHISLLRPKMALGLLSMHDVWWVIQLLFFYVCLNSRLPSRRKAEVSATVSESSEARQKFANAKAISSDMFFGRESSAEVH